MTEQFEKKLPVDKGAERAEQPIEALPETMPGKAEDQEVAQPSTPSPVAPPAAPTRDEELVMIESILSEDIYVLYNELSEAKKGEFRRRGEEVAVEIKQMLRRAKIKIHDLYELIRNWLLMLPKINRFFLEQEAKLKTDKVLQLKRSGQEIEK
jgi:hypothetical protein